MRHLRDSVQELLPLDGDRKVHVVMVGLRGAGRRTLIHAFNLDQVRETEVIKHTEPHTGFSVQVASSKAGGVKVSSWGIGGHGGGYPGSRKEISSAKLSPLWNSLGSGMSCLAITVDSSNRALWPDIREELAFLQKLSFVASAPLLVVATKSDAEGAETARDVAKEIGADQWKCGGGKWRFVSCSATTGQGVREVLATACALGLQEKEGDGYDQWLQDAARKEKEEKAAGSTAVQRATPAQYFLALACLCMALLARVLFRKLWSEKSAA